MAGMPYDDLPDVTLAPSAPKPGWKTSEFYLALIPTLFAILQNSGIIGAAERTSLANDTSKIVVGIFAIVSVVSYIRGRVVVKTNG